MIEPLAEYQFDEIEFGQKTKFSIEINESLVNEFAQISGDYNPLHMNKDFASKTKFGKRICHGMLLASFFSKLIGMHLPGKNSLYFSQTLDFQLPCFLGDTVTIEGEVIDKSPSTGIITIKTTVTNQINNCLVDGIAKVIVRENN